MKKIFYVLIASVLLLTACGASSTELQIGKVEYAAHGANAFTVATVVVSGDKVLAAFIDEYQFMSKATSKGVPNSDAGLADYFKEGMVLGSKRVNAETYSANMATKGGSTVTIDKNFDAIQEFVKDKKISELEELIKKTPEEVTEAVTGATLADSQGYITAIIEAAKAAQKNEKISYKGDVKKLTLNQVDGAPHGTKSFAITSVLTDGKKAVAVMFDEYQFMAAATTTGVPNSDAGLVANIKEGFVLGSKLANAESYSKSMKEKGGATQTLDANFKAIRDFAITQTAEELTTLLAKDDAAVTEAVTGATLADTKGYLNTILEAITTSK